MGTGDGSDKRGTGSGGRSGGDAGMSLEVRPERRLIRPTACHRHILCHVRVERLPESARPARRPVTVALVLDRSGSMAGEKLRMAKAAALALADRLAERDRLALVAFDDQIDLLLPPTRVDAAARARLRSLLGEIEARGTTALHAAWLTGCHAIAGDAAPDADEALARCFLLTDGLANVGLTDPELMAAEAAGVRARAGVGTSTFGIGEDYNEALLGPLAAGGGGQFHHLRSAGAIATTFVNELGEMLATVASHARLEIEVEPGVEVQVISAYLGQPAGGDSRRVVIGVGDLASGEERPIVVQLGFPAPAGRLAQTVRARLVWRADGAERRTDWRAVDFTYADAAACDAEAPDPAVMHWVGLHDADRAQLESIKLRRAGDHHGANAVLRATASRLAPLVPASPALQDAIAELGVAEHDADLKERYHASQTRSRAQKDLRSQ
jgi:Ca-activated chloride channel homolog